jgi:hypothetical protein
MSNDMLTKIVDINTIVDAYKVKFGDEHYERVKHLLERLYIDVLGQMQKLEEPSRSRTYTYT